MSSPAAPHNYFRSVTPKENHFLFHQGGWFNFTLEKKDTVILLSMLRNMDSWATSMVSNMCLALAQLSTPGGVNTGKTKKKKSVKELGVKLTKDFDKSW